MPSPRLSVVIPTYKRADTLTRCLEHLALQTCVKEIEVIVVSDGHDEKTTRLFQSQQWPFPVRFFEVEKSHQGVARNEGVKHARGEVVLFIGDDILLAPDACSRHLTAHRGHSSGPIAVLGYTQWDPRVGITPVMRWLERTGWQFKYPSIACYGHGLIPVGVQHRYTYTSHVSVPLAIVKAHLFRTDVHLYGWEDVEWGMRLRDAGVRLYYEPHARALHEHRITLEESLQRMEVLGESVHRLAKLVPDFDRRPRGLKLLLYRIAALFPTMAGRHRRAFLSGLDTGKLKANN
ncbi:MAG: glycosyltransferase family 2 protein [Candidatus Peribacteraceae bacterium]